MIRYEILSRKRHSKILSYGGYCPDSQKEFFLPEFSRCNPSSLASLNENRDDRKPKESDGEIQKETHREAEKDGPGPVMVSDTLCPAVHILGT